MGIAGSAVGEINVECSAAWKQIEGGLRSQYNSKLEPLKRKLAQMAMES
jgi:hypothetical protein